MLGDLYTASTGSDMVAVAGALQLAVQLGVSHTQLLSNLLQPSTAGQKFYHTFAKRLQTWAIFHADKLVPDLLAAIAAPAAAAAGDSSGAAAVDAGMLNAAAAAELLLIGCLESLLPAPAAAGSGGAKKRVDIRTSAFMHSVLTSRCRIKREPGWCVTSRIIEISSSTKALWTGGITTLVWEACSSLCSVEHC